MCLPRRFFFFDINLESFGLGNKFDTIKKFVMPSAGDI